MTIDWVSLGLGSIIGVGGTWILTRAEVFPLRKKLEENEAQVEAIHSGVERIQSGLIRIEEGQKVSAIGEDSLRDTVRMAVSTALTAIISELGSDASPLGALNGLDRSFPRLSAQWTKVTPSRDERLKLATDMVSHWQAMNKSRNVWDRNWRRNGGIQIGPDLWIPANRLVHIESAKPMSAGARFAAKTWFKQARLSILAGTILGGLLLLLFWQALPAALGLLAAFLWVILLLSNFSLFQARLQLKDEEAQRPEWSVLFPPGAIREEPCQVLFGRKSRTQVFSYPLSSWIDPTE
jgi:hypothetical protein